MSSASSRDPEMLGRMLDLLDLLLQRSQDLHGLGQMLVEEVRALSGATRAFLLVPNANATVVILAEHPNGVGSDLSTGLAAATWNAGRQERRPGMYHQDQDPGAHPLVPLLPLWRAQRCLLLPLWAGREAVGLILALDPPAADLDLANLSLFCRAGALALRNLTLLEERESALAERTAAWHRSETFNHMIIDNASVGVVVYDEQLRYVLWNPAMEQLTGMGADDVLGRPATEVFPHLEPSGCLELMRRAIAGEVTKAPDRRFQVSSTGKSGWFSATYAPLRPTIGWPGRVVAIIQDITERKQAEVDLAHQRDFNRQVLETLNCLVVVMDPDGRIVLFNHACETCSGYTAAEMVGTCIWERVIPPDQRETIRKTFHDLTAMNAYPRYENPWLTRDGQRRQISWSNSVIRNPDGSAVYVLSTGIDITEHRRAEEALRQSQKMEALGSLAGGIAHDFNNVLQGMLGYAQLAGRFAEDPARIREFLDHIVKAGLRAKDMVQRILTFSRKREHAPRTISLEPVIHEVVRFLRGTLPKDLTISCRLDPDCGPTKADPSEIHEILVNLANNAVWAIQRRPGNPAVLTITLDPVRRAGLTGPEVGSWLHLLVADTGCGMDTATRNRLFEPFFTTKPSGEGTGFGLPMVHRVVSACGGFIEVESEPGQGTTFHLYFPRCEQTTGPIEVPTAEPSGTHPQLVSHTVLVVDDEPALVEQYRLAIEQEGWKAVTFTHPEVALTALRTQGGEFDLVVSDLSMPGVTGLAVATAAKAARRDLPVILVTGFGEDLERGTWQEAGVDRLLRKPVLPSDLARTMRLLLARSVG